MVLNFTDARGLGLIESAVGISFLAFSALAVRIAKKSQGNIKIIIICGMIMGIGIIVGSLRASLILLLIWGFVEAGAGSIQYAISSGAWLIITDEEIRGRAMALRGTIAQALRPLGILIAGPLGDYLEFRAEIDLLGILSACPGGDCSSTHSSNKAKCYPLKVEIFESMSAQNNKISKQSKSKYKG